MSLPQADTAMRPRVSGQLPNHLPTIKLGQLPTGEERLWSMVANGSCIQYTPPFSEYAEAAWLL